MNYFVKRQEQEFGPYSLADLQEYVQTGNIAASDLARSEGMSEWVPVADVLGNIPIPQAVAAAPAPQEEIRELVHLPPNLPWWLLLILNVVTSGIFNFAWGLVLGNWARRMSRNNKPLVLVAMYPAGFVASWYAGAIGGEGSGAEAVGGICVLVGLVTYMIGIFSIRTAMEEYYNSTERINLGLSGGMTFFFNSIYFQYHVNRISRWKKTGILY